MFLTVVIGGLLPVSHAKNYAQRLKVKQFDKAFNP